MKEPYLEVTYRHGKPFAAYLYLPRRAGDRSARVRESARGYWSTFGATGNRSASR